MSKSNPFKWRHYEPQIILLCVRWYLSYPLSYRQVAEMVNERGLDVHYTTVSRWVQRYSGFLISLWELTKFTVVLQECDSFLLNE